MDVSFNPEPVSETTCHNINHKYKVNLLKNMHVHEYMKHTRGSKTPLCFPEEIMNK